MTELQLGKYKFYPYEFDKSKTRTLEEFKELLRKAKAKKAKGVKTSLRAIRKRKLHRKRRG